MLASKRYYTNTYYKMFESEKLEGQIRRQYTAQYKREIILNV
jgi:hypothetical protein